MEDLESIIKSAHNQSTRPLIRDTVRCYSSGAYRSAVVSLWIAVFYDLTSKIRKLSESGYGPAAAYISDLDNAVANGDVPKLQRIESSLIEEARSDFELISTREGVELRRLYEDRNLCAHPAFGDADTLFQPTEEAVRAHIAAANSAVFSQRPVAGKSMIASMQSDLSSRSWPLNKDLDDFLYSKYFDRTRVATQRNLAKILVKGSIRPQDDSRRYAQHCRLACHALERRDAELYYSTLKEVLETWASAGSITDEDLSWAVGAHGHYARFWESIPQAEVSRIESLLNREDVGFFVENRLFASGTPAHPRASEKYLELLAELDLEELETVSRYTRDKESLLNHALDEVGGV
ncbi:hypothetical protein [Luteococcus japonicus]|uniref:hypothetical protein n=1 Tax=Luteococcus japonicus TaxID=33984 RepID=UPI00117DE305|nr:hypothetical protein [Luteococcus japonicus]